MKKRNSLIEFYRFFFAINVLICHGFLPFERHYFGPDRVSVEFFFILSGYLFYRSLSKLSEMNTVDALKATLVSKLKPLLIPMIIGMVCNGVLNYLTNHTPVFEVFRYLWYIPAMLITLMVYTLLRKLIKKDKPFWCLVGCLFVIATLLRFSGNERLFFFDYIRSTASISLGMLIAKLPRPTFKNKAVSWIVLLVIATATLLTVIFGLAEDNVAYEALLDILLYPALIYFTFGVEFHFAPFNYLGALSFGIYAFQCPARLMAHIGMPSSWIPFGFVFVAAIVEDLIKRIIKKKKMKASTEKHLKAD